MADYPWPDDLAPFAQSFYLQPHVGGSESPFTRQRKVYGLSAPRWVTRLSFRGGYDNGGSLRDVGGRLDALLVKLQGGVNRALVWDFRRPRWTGPGLSLAEYTAQFEGQEFTFDQGETFTLAEVFVIPAVTTEPVSQAASAGATEMTFSGFEWSALIFKPGDYIGGDGRAHIVLEPAYSNDDGEVTVTFSPPLAADVPAGQGLVEQVTSPFRLISDDAGANMAAVGDAVSYDFELVEDL